MKIRICGVAHKVRTFAGAKALAMRLGATRFETPSGTWGFRDGRWNFYPKEINNVPTPSREEGWKIYHSCLSND